MKLLPILLLAALATSGCSSMQTSPTAAKPAPVLSARQSAEKQLHEGMLKLLADAEKPAQQDLAMDALSSSAEYVANAK